MKTQKQIDGAAIQDLYHYALAMTRDSNSAFPCDTLVRRLNAANSVYEKLTTIEGDEFDQWDFDFIVPSDRYERESDLLTSGRLLLAKVKEAAKELGVDPFTGEKLA